MEGMEVWDDSTADRRSPAERRSRIRRWLDRQDTLFLLPVLGGVLLLVFTSLGFTVSGSGQAIAEIRTANVVRDTAIARLQRRNESSSSRLDAVTYLVCEIAKHDDPSTILPIECSRVKPNPDPQ
jgi:hypothetical protein